jgi:peptidyl-prolyl cis-trans isomerase SurA
MMKPIPVNQKANRLQNIFKIASRCLAKKEPAWLFALLVATIVTAGPRCANLWAQESEVVDRIVAVVNNEIITLYELNRAFAPYVNKIKRLEYPPEKERQTLFQVRKDILSQLIDGMLANQQVRRDKITVSQKEINNAIERIKESRQLTDEQMRQGLEGQGMTMEEYRKEIEDQILRSKLVNREVKSKIVITKEDIKAYYESHREKYAQEKKYYLWNMYTKVSSSSGSLERSNALNKMEAILARLKQGQSFESLVKEVKKSSFEVRGTDLGSYNLKDLSEQLQQVVKKMGAGEFSDVLDTDFGYQIIYVQKIEDSQAKSFEAVESEIEEILYKEFVDNKYQEWLEQLRARSHIRIIN